MRAQTHLGQIPLAAVLALLCLIALGPHHGVMAADAPAQPKEGDEWTVPELGMVFVWVKPGKFKMGDDDGGKMSSPEHPVVMTRGFWMGKYEVTLGEYETIMGRYKDQNNAKNGARVPVDCISWENAVEYCIALNKREGAAKRLPAGYHYRMPTEAEWEFAAKTGRTDQGDLDDSTWNRGNSKGDSQEVGTKKANALGIHDMLGNIQENCLDGFRSYSADGITDPVGELKPGKYRQRRGGSYKDRTRDLSITDRVQASAQRRKGPDELGMRLVLARNPGEH